MNALRAMYGLRRVCLAAVVTVLSASTIHLIDLPSQPAAVHLTQAIRKQLPSRYPSLSLIVPDDLQAMSTNHPSAARCINTIYGLARKWGISLPPGVAPSVVVAPSEQPVITTPPMSAIFTHAMLATEPMDRFAATPNPGESSRTASLTTSFPNLFPREIQPQIQHPGQFIAPASQPRVSEAYMWTSLPATTLPLQPSDYTLMSSPAHPGFHVQYPPI